jgi:hypothetical protein
MKWSSSGFLAVLATINLGFGFIALAEICQTFGLGFKFWQNSGWNFDPVPDSAFFGCGVAAPPVFE